MQPVPEVSEADVIRVVERDFPRAERAAAFAALGMSGTQAHEDASVRVRLAALKLANGSLARLLRELADAKVDFRDVIGPAEYPRAMKAWSRTDMDDVQRQRIYDADWREYTEWLRRE